MGLTTVAYEGRISGAAIATAIGNIALSGVWIIPSANGMEVVVIKQAQ
jgi:hypothetical protein